MDEALSSETSSESQDFEEPAPTALMQALSEIALTSPALATLIGALGQPEPRDPVATNVIQALALVTADVGVVTKGRKSGKDGGLQFAYRGIEDVLNALHGPLSKHGVVIIPRVTEVEREPVSKGKSDNWHRTRIVVEYDIYGPGGPDDTLPTPPRIVVDADDNSDKGFGKAISYAYKAMALQVFAMPTEDVSIDNEAPQLELGEDETIAVVASDDEIDEIVTRAKSLAPEALVTFKDFTKAAEVSLRAGRGTTHRELKLVTAFLNTLPAPADTAYNVPHAEPSAAAIE